MPDLIIIVILAALIIWCMGQAKASRERREHIEKMAEHQRVMRETVPQMAEAAATFKSSADAIHAEVLKYGEDSYRAGVQDGKRMTDALWRLSRLGQEIERKEQAQ